METRGRGRNGPNNENSDEEGDDPLLGGYEVFDDGPINPQKKRRSKPFPWTDLLEMKSLTFVQKRKAHIKTDVKQSTKFDLVAQDLVRLDAQTFASINGESLKRKWTRMAKIYKTKFSLTSEGANLSGLGEPTKLEKMAIGLLETVYRIEME